MSIYEYDAEKHIAMEKEESWNEGHIEGCMESHIELIRIKMLKSKSLEVIANELECDGEEIRGLYDAVKECGLESGIEEIMKIVMK